jgi:DNA-binding transcriptional MerR regulator
MDDLLDIGEVAARTGMAASALRYYEREGILVSADRKGLRRQYQPKALDTLAVVALCQRAGFSLAEIKALLATGGEQSWKTIAARKRDELRSQIRYLEVLAGHLDHALGCPSPNVFDCEHFQSALRQALRSGDPASSKMVRQRHRQATLPAIGQPVDPDISRAPLRPGGRG